MTREEREAAISTLEYIKEYCHYEYEKETIDKVQEALNQEPILDKIRERIELEKLGYPPSAGYYKAIMRCLQIIDKYKEESEEMNENS